MLEKGQGELLQSCDADEIREWNRSNKSRGLIDKVTTATSAVERFVKDGSYLGIGGFGHIRISMPMIYEMVRQKVKRLRVSGHTAVHDLDVLIAGDCVDAVERLSWQPDFSHSLNYWKHHRYWVARGARLGHTPGSVEHYLHYYYQLIQLLFLFHNPLSKKLCLSNYLLALL